MIRVGSKEVRAATCAGSAEAAAQLGMKVLTVFKAKSKVQKMLQEEVARLEADPRAE